MPETTIDAPARMFVWTAQITFRTAYPLAQKTAQEFWGRGLHFHAVPGPRTYEWTAEILAETALGAAEHLEIALREILKVADLRRVEVQQSSVRKTGEIR